tara:strand:+ start:205 stop:849 length:645 start_codon:yes stop_codon:yes gene_type:complete
MDEDLSIINTNTRNERIKRFIQNNKKIIISIFIILILSLIFFFGLGEYNKNKRSKISEIYNSAIIEYSDSTKKETLEKLIKIINAKDPTYSPLSLYFIIDNKLISETSNVNKFFDVLINKTSLEPEIKNLVIYKKALFNADQANENDLMEILNPVINSKSVWKSHALYLVAEYFYAKNEKNKSKEFFNQIMILENSNPDIKKEAQKRLNRDLSD